MNFFDAQERSLRNTRKLVLLMTLAVVVVVAAVSAVIIVVLWLSTNANGYPNPLAWAADNPQILSWTLAGTAGFIGFASLYRVASLRSGGGRVARDLGGTQILPGDPDPLHRQLRNVVEEMALASGVATPEIYLLSQEAGINAFAAGFGPDDAAIAVTRGTLETLSREELQGVIAHEFSHVLNGDMRLNIRLMGPLFGILAIGLLGRLLLRSMRGTRRSSRSKGGGTAAILALGLGLTVTGYVGLLAGRLIKAGVSRQREYLADASAVQFTRQTRGIAGALKKIAGFAEHSQLQDSEAEEVSHMLFADGLASLSGMLATHPPLLTRIQALDPSFTNEALAQLQTDALAGASLSGGGDTSDGLTKGFAPEPGKAIAADPDSLLQSIGNPDDRHLAAARNFRGRLPATIDAALAAADQVMLLLPALILQSDAAKRAQQLDTLEKQVGRERRARIETLHTAIADAQGPARLPLLELALPQLKLQPASRQEYLLDLMTQLANQDNRIDLFEYALLRSVSDYIYRSANPGVARRWRGLGDRKMRSAAESLLGIYSRHGHRDEASAVAAYNAGTTILGSASGVPASPDDWVRAADVALLQLQSCLPKDRQLLIKALLTVALHDGAVSFAESELLRAVCALLECPVPPILNAA